MGKKKRANRKKARTQAAETDLSICMIVKNEEAHLPQCLESIRPLGAELIVVDTGSTDKTPEIARKFGAKLFHFPWNNNFSDARNHSLAQATRRWILWLDADDIVPATEHAKIRHLAAKDPTKAFHFILKNRGIDDSQCYQLRMFPNHPKIRFEGAIHEQAARAIHRLNFPVENRDVVIIHTGYSSEEIVRAKKKKYLGMMAEWLKTHPDDCLIQYQFALTNHTLNRHEEAVRAFEKFLLQKDCLNQDRNVVFYSLILAGRSHVNLGHLDEALHYLLEAQRLEPDSDFLKMSLAEVYTNRNESQKAIEYLDSVGDLRRPKITFMPLDYSVLRFGKEVLLATNWTRLGELEKAKIHLKEAEKMHPNRAEVAHAWGEWFEKTGNLTRARNAYEKAIQLEPEAFLYHFKKATVCLALGDALEAKRAYEMCERFVPGKKEVLVNLGILERVYGRLEAALGYFERARKADPNDPAIVFQTALTYFDWGQWEKCAAQLDGVPRTEEKHTLLLLLTLLQLKNISAFGEVLVSFLEHAPYRALFTRKEIPEGFKRLSEQFTRKKRFVEAELAFHIFVAGLPTPALQELGNLAEKQMASFHLNAAVATLENILVHTSHVDTQIRCLRNLEKCYQARGIPEAVALCRKQIAALTQKKEMQPV